MKTIFIDGQPKKIDAPNDPQNYLVVELEKSVLFFSDAFLRDSTAYVSYSYNPFDEPNFVTIHLTNGDFPWESFIVFDSVNKSVVHYVSKKVNNDDRFYVFITNKSGLKSIADKITDIYDYMTRINSTTNALNELIQET